MQYQIKCRFIMIIAHDNYTQQEMIKYIIDATGNYYTPYKPPIDDGFEKDNNETMCSIYVRFITGLFNLFG